MCQETSCGELFEQGLNDRLVMDQIAFAQHEDLPPLDDGSYLYVMPEEIFPNGVPFGGRNRRQLFVNVNGNVSFGGPNTNYTAEAIPGLAQPSIAVFYADVDLRDGLTDPNPGRVTICEDIDNNRVLITWTDVYHFDADTVQTFDHLNTFQLNLTDAGVVCIEEADEINGVDVEFRYERLTWYAGQQSGSNANGLCPPNSSVPDECTPAAAGFDAGDGETAIAVPGSRTRRVLEAFTQESNVDEDGVWRFQIVGTLAGCGNGTRDPCEICDEGGNTAGCDEDCTDPECGDGLFNSAAGEECDDGIATDTCSAACEWLGCGDGETEALYGEECDDGNNEDGDGCSADCQDEGGNNQPPRQDRDDDGTQQLLF